MTVDITVEAATILRDHLARKIVNAVDQSDLDGARIMAHMPAWDFLCDIISQAEANRVEEIAVVDEPEPDWVRIENEQRAREGRPLHPGPIPRSAYKDNPYADS